MRIVKFRGMWAAYVPGKNGRNGKRHSLRTRDYATALENFEIFKRQYEQKNETVGEIVEAYLEAKKDKASIGGMEDAWASAKHRFSILRPTQCVRGVCESYTQERQDDDVSNGTIRKELGVIRQALKWKGYQVEITLPPEAPPKERYLTKEEYRRLLDSCSTPHLKLFVQLALHTGARKGAILDLQWKQVDLERGVITLSKGVQTNKRRATVPINETLKTALLGVENRLPESYVIEWAGERVKSINMAFRRARERAGLGDVTPHDLRRTAATWMAMAGVSMQDIAAYLGHSNIQTTYKVYAKFAPDYLRKAAAALDV